MFVAILKRYVAAKDAIESVLDTSKRSIQDSIEKLRVREKIMRNYVDMYERATFFLKGSCGDKFLGHLLKFMMKTGSEKLFPNLATASTTIESMRILMRSRQGGAKLTLTAVWEQIRSEYLSTSGASGEDV